MKSKRPSLLVLSSLMLGCLTACASQHPPTPFAGDGQGPMLLAHRGIAQTYSPIGLDNQTCTASRIDPPVHDLLENTLPSLAAAFSAGADVAELDIHPTSDGDFAVFHDWTLECITNGKGVTREHSLAELKALDIGWGYTADGGQTYPFRGKGIGLMPSLKEVLERFPEQLLLINIKSRDPLEGELLAKYLAYLPAERLRHLAVYGGTEPIEKLREHLPEMLTLSRDSLKNCLLPYLAFGWTGALPADCAKRLVLVPINYAPWLWGWPNRFLAQMREVGSAVYVVGPYHGGPNTGLDQAQDLAQLPPGYTGGIWTNQLIPIAKALQSNN